MLEIRRTEDGSDTIFVAGLNEHYHSIHGAVRESEVIYLNGGFNYCTAEPVRIFEAGFGTGLNALLTALQSIKDGRRVFYTAIEKDPLPHDIFRSLNYPELTGKEGKALFETMHSCQWNVPVKIRDNFTLLKVQGDLTAGELTGQYDLIYFDAFGPEKQPEMWSIEVFRKISSITAMNGILVTYSVKGEVKRGLRETGFTVKVLPGPPGKRHILRAVKI